MTWKCALFVFRRTQDQKVPARLTIAGNNKILSVLMKATRTILDMKFGMKKARDSAHLQDGISQVTALQPPLFSLANQPCRKYQTAHETAVSQSCSSEGGYTGCWEITETTALVQVWGTDCRELVLDRRATGHTGDSGKMEVKWNGRRFCDSKGLWWNWSGRELVGDTNAADGLMACREGCLLTAS